MADAINVMIALQTPDGLSFGYVMDASARHVRFTVNNNLQPGLSFAWRMELQGYAETIMGRLTVTQAYPPPSAGEWPRYDAKIDEIPEDDGVLLSVWMEDQSKGGSSRRIERDPARFIKDMFADSLRGTSSNQTKLIIERMNERTARRKARFGKKKPGVGGDFGLSIESTIGKSGSVSSAQVRTRISLALGGFSRRQLEEPELDPAPRTPLTPAAPDNTTATATGWTDAEAGPDLPMDRPGPERKHPTARATVGQAPAPTSRTTEQIIAAALRATGLPPKPAPATHPPAAPEPVTAPPPAAPRRPRSRQPEPMGGLCYDDSHQPPLLELRYPQAGDFAEDYRRHLKNRGLFLAGHIIGARGDELRVCIVLPDQVFDCTAQVVAVMASGTGLALNLDRTQLTAMAAAAR